MEKMKRWISVLLTVCMLAVMLPMPAVSEEGDAPAPTQTASAPAADPAPTATQAEEQTSISSSQPTATPVSTDKATATATPVPTDEATATPTPAPTDEATGTPAPVPTDEAEVKTIASFEAVAPEGFAVPQGTLETDLGLPASLNVQFTDGAAGEVAVTWQCAAGYDPSAEAGTQFIFAAVLPEGYALHEGVSLPQIFVTLTPPLANAMLAVQASGMGWTLSDDGTPTVTGDVNSNVVSPWNGVTSIEVAGKANFILDTNVSFSGSITVMAHGGFSNHGNVSGDISVESGGVFANSGTISGGIITGQVNNLDFGTITGGDFTGATVADFGGTITGGMFNGYTIADGRLTITASVVFSQDMLTDGVERIIVTGTGSIIGSDGAVAKRVEVQPGGAISGGEFTGEVYNDGTISGGTFSGFTTNAGSGLISGGTFSGEVANISRISGGVFDGTVENQSQNSLIQGDGKTTPTLNGEIVNRTLNGVGTPRILQPCDFGPEASVTSNRGTIEVTMTVNGENKTFQYGEKVLNALNVIKPGADWCAVEGETRTPVEAEAAFGLQSCSYDYTYYVEGLILFITAPVEVTDDMLKGISIVHVTATGEITGGTLNSDSWIDIAVNGVISGGTFSGNMGVDYWYGEITGGTFNCPVYNYATISGGTFNGGVWNRSNAGSVPVIQGKDGRIPEINGWIFSDASTAKIRW